MDVNIIDKYKNILKLIKEFNNKRKATEWQD